MHLKHRLHDHVSLALARVAQAAAVVDVLLLGLPLVEDVSLRLSSQVRLGHHKRSVHRLIAVLRRPPIIRIVVPLVVLIRWSLILALEILILWRNTIGWPSIII